MGLEKRASRFLVAVSALLACQPKVMHGSPSIADWRAWAMDVTDAYCQIRREYSNRGWEYFARSAHINPAMFADLQPPGKGDLEETPYWKVLLGIRRNLRELGDAIPAELVGRNELFLHFSPDAQAIPVKWVDQSRQPLVSVTVNGHRTTEFTNGWYRLTPDESDAVIASHSEGADLQISLKFSDGSSSSIGMAAHSYANFRVWGNA